MKQADNYVVIEGILSEVKFKKGVSKKGANYISGEVIIKVDKETENGVSTSYVPVKVMTMEHNAKGDLSPVYQNIEKFWSNYNSIATVADESLADRIRINGGNLQENFFHTKNGQFFTGNQIRTSFITKIQPQELTPKATFSNTIVVGSVKEEIVNDAPTGRLVLQGIIPQYSKNDAEPAVDICTFFVENPAAVNHIQTYWAQGDTVKVAGEIEFTSEKKITYSDTGFGKPISETSTRTKKELIITSGSPGSLSDEEAYDAEEIQKGLLRRQTRIEEDKARVSSTSTPAPMAKKASLTF